MSEHLRHELELLNKIQGEADARKIIDGMFVWLGQGSVKESSKAIVAVLETQDDAFTFGRFAPGKDGYLSGYPTFRTALMDFLEKLDPASAVTLGKTILDTSENPDEWVLSLRALARHGVSTDDQDFLQSKITELLHKEAWLEEPSFSYLQAFDATVADGRSSTLQRLGEIVAQPPNRAVGHAAILSVDRLFQLHTSAGTNYIVENPTFLEATPGFRATLMARVDPTFPPEMASVETYLGMSHFSNEEKRTFLQTFPNFNSTYSYNLITASTLLSREEMRERSVSAFNQMSGWIKENRYPEFRDEISGAVQRLATVWKLEL